MGQIHKRFDTEQVEVLLRGYRQGTLDRSAIEETLGVGRSGFFALLEQYRRDPDRFSLAYRRQTPRRLPASVEREIEKELMLDKDLLDDSTLPIATSNYSATRDRLAKRAVTVSLSTIIDRAKNLGYYQPHPRKKAHDRHWCFNPAQCFPPLLVSLRQREMGFEHFSGRFQGETNGAVGHLPAKGVSQSPLLNRKSVHFSKIPNNSQITSGIDKN